MQGSYSETATESESESSQHSTVTTAASTLPKRKCKRCKRLSEEVTTTSVKTKGAKVETDLVSEEATPTSKKAKPAKVETDLIMNSFVVGHLVRLGLSEERVKEGWSLVPVERKKKIEEEYKALMLEEMQRLARKANLLRDLFA
ncbi:unnamed protein product [Microthlaspi erraticum]|uniref:Glabrous enhancer-binding protein-like C-terminal domain-containing protein n=1 Tax=Microthlaspi erraticum TaxID=1685480 RepID=A0A6D2L7Z2_9BRAS|nr:unnamed protein product [Microthlaspi erraticum]